MNSPEIPDAAENTDIELWRETEGDAYAASIHVTKGGGIGINCGGRVYVKPIREWHRLASLQSLGEIPDAAVEAAIKAGGMEGWDYIDLRMRDALTAALPHLAAGRAEAVAVKPLEFNEHKALDGRRKLVAYDVFGHEYASLDLHEKTNEKTIAGFKALSQRVYDGRIRSALVSAPAVPSETHDDEDRCIACDKPFKPGDRVLNDVSGGSIHIECCGPDRESYVGPGDPLPKGYVWQPAPAAEAEPAPVAWPSGFFAIGGDARLRDCATEGCGQHVSIRVERGGVGSDHCEPCARKIAAALAQSDAAGGE